MREAHVTPLTVPASVIYRGGNHQRVKQKEIILQVTYFQVGFVFEWILPAFLSLTAQCYVIAEHNGLRPWR